jgi:uncharacterized protein (DUF885 family)
MRGSILLLLSLLGPTAALLALSGPPGTAADAAASLHALFNEEWDRQMEENPTRASLLGDRRWNDRWPDVSPAAQERRQEADRGALARLRTIDRAVLSAEDQLNFDLFEYDSLARLEDRRHGWHLVPLDMRSGIHTAHELASSLRFETGQDYRDWLGRLRGFTGYMDGTIALLREGIREGIVQPRLIIERVAAQVEHHLVDQPEKSPFYRPFTAVPEAIPQATRASLSDAAREAISAEVLPAFQRFDQFLRTEYLPAAYPRAGIWQAPNGQEMYAFLARKHTTTEMTPKEIHEIGLAEVKRIREAMQGIMRQTGFEGSLKEFFHFLRTDPQFYYDSPEALLTAYRAMSRVIDPQLVRVFRTLPRMPYGIEPIPDLTAPHTTTAYYRPPAADGSRAGTYFVNLYRPETRPTFEMMALSLHEAVPGHHLQIALAQEKDVPNFRRYGGYTAFVEGWALYAESLGEDLGLYEDPYSKFGQLTYEMWRAVRLVVDTGMHAFRWDRQRAIDFFMEHAPKAELDIVNEIDRYIGWPGQALAYKVGELRIKDLRARATRTLGERFDIREFHEIVLQEGALPIAVLESRVIAWVDE